MCMLYIHSIKVHIRMFRGFICCQWYIPLNHWSIAQRLPDVLDALSQSRSTTDQDAEPAGCAEKLVLDLGNASTDRKRQLFCRIVPLQVPILMKMEWNDVDEWLNTKYHLLHDFVGNHQTPESYEEKTKGVQKKDTVTKILLKLNYGGRNKRGKITVFNN
ncbi:unnamed protein product [Nezara viridula]|uniref:Uncharacterized protein n=1 Tax=Nezara viridula TaxID=85310 RepID=A0A9P0HMI1_NEZVI|nr:unnamed protein product [Nezara viridula]